VTLKISALRVIYKLHCGVLTSADKLNTATRVREISHTALIEGTAYGLDAVFVRV
jgi:hypothetical protein